VATLSSGGHITNTFALNYWVCNLILASGDLILNFFGGTGGPEISLGAAAPLGTAPGTDYLGGKILG